MFFKKKKYFFIIFIIFLIGIFYVNSINEKKEIIENVDLEEKPSNSNIIKDVRYVSKDSKGNEYIIEAQIGEIDRQDNNIIFLTNVVTFINLVNSNNIKITSNFGKYNSTNHETIFSQNVNIYYLDNKITGEYLDFSLIRNSMIISKNVVYTNTENIIKADVIEIDTDTKDTKIFMQEDSKKVNIKSKE